MIEVKNLTKKYGSHLALDNISFTFEKEVIYGFLGPNGAGKSTAMNIITGYIGATEGQVLINGHDIFEEPEEAKRFIGYLPEQPPLYLDMTVYEYLKFAAELKGISKSEIESQIKEVMDTTQVFDVEHRLIKYLSKGYRQRVGLAQAILGYPEIVILDEPTVGLDPKQIIEIRELIKSLGQKHTVILSSHILSEISAVCDFVLILSHGRLVASDTTENLGKIMRGTNFISLTIKGAETNIRKALYPIDGISKLIFDETENGLTNLKIECSTKTELTEAIFYALSDARCPIMALTSQNMSLEEVFLEFTSDTSDEIPEPEVKEQNRKEVMAIDSDL